MNNDDHPESLVGVPSGCWSPLFACADPSGLFIMAGRLQHCWDEPQQELRQQRSWSSVTGSLPGHILPGTRFKTHKFLNRFSAPLRVKSGVRGILRICLSVMLITLSLGRNNNTRMETRTKTGTRMNRTNATQSQTKGCKIRVRDQEDENGNNRG